MNRKSILLVVTLLVVSVLGTYLIGLNNLGETEFPPIKTDIIPVEKSFELDRADNGLYQSRYSYVSDRIETLFDYNAVGLEWEGNVPAKTNLKIAIRSSDSDIWRQLDLERDVPNDELESIAVDSTELMFFSKPRKHLQYRIVLSSENPTLSPTINSLKLHYFYAGDKDPSYAASLLKILKADADNFKIISRDQWRAPEHLGVYNPEDPPETINWKVLDPEAKALEDEILIVKTVRQNEEGEELIWNREYPVKIETFVVHHTATDYPETFAESLQAVRNIAYWHSVVKHWGDIGYNYLIDPLGNVYEGRAGGDGVTGGHAAYHNKGSIGIGILGDYSTCEYKFDTESEEYIKCLAGDSRYAAHSLTPKAEQALIDLIAYKGALHGINPMGSSTWRGKRSVPSVIGHRDVGATYCPGDNIYNELPEIRKKAAKKYFELLPNIKRLELADKFDYKASQKDLYQATPNGAPRKIQAESGKDLRIALRFENTGTMEWFQNSHLAMASNYPELEILGNNRSLQKTAKPGESGIFNLNLGVSPQASGNYSLTFYPIINGKEHLKDAKVKITLKVNNVNQNEISSNDPENVFEEIATILEEANPEERDSSNPTIRVLISGFEDQSAKVSSRDKFSIYLGTEKAFHVDAGDTIEIEKNGVGLEVRYGKEKEVSTRPLRLISNNVLTVDSLKRRPAWNKKLNDNSFRGNLEFRQEGGTILLINELPLESYLQGVAEVPSGEPFEKMKILSVTARNYAYHYTDPDYRKYPGKPYDGSDDPNTFQKYLGYNYELRTPEWPKAVMSTVGEMVTYQGKVIKTPYFNQSDGMTRSAEEVWGWTHAPYLKAVEDPLCPEKIQRGHGVGLSGCGATAAVKQGKNYLEVLKYYYSDVEVEKIY